MPNGVRTFQGAVAYGRYAQVDVLEFGVTSEQKQAMDAKAAAELLATAKIKLSLSSETSQRAGMGTLKTIERKYPSTDAAKEARRMLDELKK